jgi:hypothetical protein
MQTKSRIDGWVAVVLVATIVVCLWAGVSIIAGGSITELLLGMAVLAGGALLPGWMLWRTDYKLDTDALVARSGPFRWRVAYADIRKATRKRCLLSGPALSMDRIVIDYGPWRQLVISPRDPEHFLVELQSRREKH